MPNKEDATCCHLFIIPDNADRWTMQWYISAFYLIIVVFNSNLDGNTQYTTSINTLPVHTILVSTWLEY